jgi:drug/metabolite transporter (DMT)-like permease
MFYISLLLVIIGTVSYDLLEKTIPKKENVYLYLAFTYLVALSTIFIVLIASSYDLSNLTKDINWQSFLVGMSAMFVDYGLILSYKKGWKISSLNITYTTCVLIILMIVGNMFFDESISKTELIGVLLCIISIFLINHKNHKRGGRR